MDAERRRKITGARIRQGRQEMPGRPSQRTFGRLIGVSDVTVGSWEAGDVDVGIPRLEQIAQLQGKRLLWYMEESEDIAPAPQPPSVIFNELSRYIYRYVPLYDALRGQPIDYVTARCSFERLAKLKAYQIPGLVLPPDIEEGDILIVEVGRDPKLGQLVVYPVGQYAHVGRWPVPNTERCDVIVQLVRMYPDDPK